MLFRSSQLSHWVRKQEKYTIVLLGHAYNPFTMQSDENEILDSIAKTTSSKEFFEYFNQVTGCFTLLVFTDTSTYIFGDPTGMQTTFYGMLDGKKCIASHANLVGDIFELEQNDYIKRLVGYKYFKLLGNSLPGDLSPFENVKRLIPNHYACFRDNQVKTERFFCPSILDFILL